MSLYATGVRALVDEYMLEKAKEERDYGEYWSASSAGYCMRKLIFERLKVPKTQDDDARKQRVFEVGHIFHAWMQGITHKAGFSLYQETELQNEELMVRGHFDDLILADNKPILYDYKTQNSRAFTWQKGKPMSYFHHMQLGTYLYMLRNMDIPLLDPDVYSIDEGRILKISKDDMRTSEQQLMWSEELEDEVKDFWTTLNNHWKNKTLPKCTCADHENGFMAGPKYNPYFYNDEPCSLANMVKCYKEETWQHPDAKTWLERNSGSLR